MVFQYILRRRKRAAEEGSLAFLDIISCSFGAIVLLLLIMKPIPENEDPQQLKAQHELLQARQVALEQARQEVVRLSKRINEASTGRMKEDRLKKQFQAALQDLDAEMRWLKLRPDDAKVGGIPADSRHIIFIIDTSGSMQSYAWHKVQEQMAAILDVYPQVEGVQIMNDMGEYMYPGYRGRWLKDTPSRRKRILNDIKGWGAFSNSNPVEGIYTAIRQYAKQVKNMSLYVLGDDFSGSMQSVLNQVEQLNRGVGEGHQVRVHAIGFYTPGVAEGQAGFHKFARLHELTRRNKGTFIGISTR